MGGFSVIDVKIIITMEKLTCRVCNIEKPIEEFAKHKRMKLGYDYICKKCNSEKSTKWANNNRERYLNRLKDWHKKNKEGVYQKQKNRNLEISKFIEDYKNDKSCSICGYNKCKKALHFHHVDEKEKEFNISESIRETTNIERIKKEIDKCIILCANCHIELHDK